MHTRAGVLWSHSTSSRVSCLLAHLRMGPPNRLQLWSCGLLAASAHRSSCLDAGRLRLFLLCIWTTLGKDAATPWLEEFSVLADLHRALSCLPPAAPCLCCSAMAAAHPIQSGGARQGLHEAFQACPVVQSCAASIGDSSSQREAQRHRLFCSLQQCSTEGNKILPNRAGCRKMYANMVHVTGPDHQP